MSFKKRNHAIARESFPSRALIVILPRALRVSDHQNLTIAHHTIIVECFCAAGNQLLNRISVQSPDSNKATKLGFFEQNIVVVLSLKIQLRSL